MPTIIVIKYELVISYFIVHPFHGRKLFESPPTLPEQGCNNEENFYNNSTFQVLYIDFIVLMLEYTVVCSNPCRSSTRPVLE